MPDLVIGVKRTHSVEGSALRPVRLGGGHVEYARPAEGVAHADAAALDGDDEYSRLRAAASVFVELQEEEEHSFKSLLEKEVL